ncbi:MAG: TrkA family potassium uptake protein, partial [Eggerthellaceae bacterium]|nr:TrkA family potassium uptake protein [Eggerthellaceae bacterium]
MYIVICGGGKIGSYLAQVLSAGGHEIAVIEESEEVAAKLSADMSNKALVICGNGCDSKYQEDAGVRKADMFVATTGRDDDNLVACEIAKRVFNVRRCVSRVNSPKNLRIFRELNIECVSSTTIIAELIQEEALMGVASAEQLLSKSGIVIAELDVPEMRYHPSDFGILTRSIPMPENSLIIAVVSDGTTTLANDQTSV